MSQASHIPISEELYSTIQASFAIAVIFWVAIIGLSVLLANLLGPSASMVFLVAVFIVIFILADAWGVIDGY